MRRAILVLGAVMAVLMFAMVGAGAALADTVIDTTPQANSSIQPFGSGEAAATYGQFITAPANDTQLDSFTFFIMPLSGTVVFRGEVYAWDGEKATGPNLYESAPRTVTTTSGFEEVTFDTGGVQLVPGQQYVLFATISKDYELSNGSAVWQAVRPVDAYPGGHFVYLNHRSFFDMLFTDPWKRGDTDTDLAFKAVFSAGQPTPPDNDGDGVADTDDNCPSLANADQADLDNDGQGNVCDGDRDGEGVANDSDYAPDDPNVQTPPPPSAPTDKADCRQGGYKDFGFQNQGQCIKAVNATN